MTDVPGGDVAVVSTAEALERMAHTVAELEARARLVVITVLDDQQAMEAMKEETFSSIRALADALGLPSPRHRWTGRHGTAQAPLPRAAHAATIDEAVEAMLLRSEWRDPTRRNCRHYLCGRRFRGFCQTSRIATVDELTTDHVEQFMDQQRGLISNKTREGYRRYLRALAAFQRDVPGYGQGLADMGRVKKPTLPRRPPAAPSLSREQEDTCVRAASGRDRLILELLLATGMRVSELC
ncbi:MAG: hypothetical protein ACREQ5_26435, partial [Candidatus Dormibacteria bacterium]